MPVYFVTGKLGAGKTLACVDVIKKALIEKRRVATNLDLFFDKWPNPKRETTDCYRLPDKPTIRDMQLLGMGHELPKPDENKNGVIVLDELGTWMNSRSWQDKGRQEFLDWCLHARKLRWDLYFIVQNMDIIDKQLRLSLCEHLVVCKRMDRLKIPLIGIFIKIITGHQPRMPKLHVAIVKYGDQPQSPVADHWVYRGSDLYDFYDTEQCFVQSDDGLSCYLSPWHLVGRYLKPLHWYHDRVLPYLAKFTYAMVKYMTQPMAKSSMKYHALIVLLIVYSSAADARDRCAPGPLFDYYHCAIDIKYKTGKPGIDAHSVCFNYPHNSVAYRGCRFQAKRHFKKKCNDLSKTAKATKSPYNRSLLAEARKYCTLASQLK